MRHGLLAGLALVALSSTSAWASNNWVVYKSENAAWAYDAGDLFAESDKGMAIATYAMYSAAGGTMGGTTYNYSVTKATFMCADATVRVGEVSLYDKSGTLIRTMAATPNATARPVGSFDVDKISKLLFSIGCAGEFPPSGAVQATSLADALKRMK